MSVDIKPNPSASGAGVTSVNGDSGPNVVLDTGDISEGSNLYYTNARADARIAAADLTDLNDVNYTAGAGIDGQFLKYVNANNRWEASAAPASSDNLDDVVGRGATTATAIQTGGLTVSGDIDPTTNATYSIGDESTRFVSYYGDMNGAIRFKAKNDSGGVINKGEAVYIKGVSGTVPTVAKAQSNSASTMQSFGLALANANDQAEIQIITFGNLEGINTSSFSAGDTVYISSASAGALVNSAPSGEANLIQNIGKVVRSHATDGIIKVGGAGRTNATPNLDQNKIFLGNASNQAVSTALSSINLSSFNNNLDTDDISEGTTNLYYTNARFDTQLGTKDTDDLSEGTTNLYYTNARADARIAAANMTDLNDVNYTAGAGIDGQFLKYVNANNRWEAAAVPGGVSTVNGDSGPNVTLDTDDISEGTTNLYYTNARFDTQLGTKDTDDLSEGTTNLYYTNARADARIAAANLTDLNDVNYTAGSSIDNYVLTYNHANTRWEAEESTASAPNVTLASPSATYGITQYRGIEEIYILTPSADISVTLPAASSCGSGYKYQIKNMASANTLTIDPNSTETIDGSTTYEIANQYESVTIVTNGSNWFII